MKKRRLLFSTFLIAGAAALFGLASCNRPSLTPVKNNTDEEKEKTHQEQLFNNLLSIRNLDATLDVDIKYLEHEFKIAGSAYVTLDTIDDIKADMNLTLDMPSEDSFKTQTIKATYINSTFYASITNRNLKLHTDNINDILELFTKEEVEEEEKESTPTTLKTTHIADLLKNIGDMTAEVNGNEISYVIKTFEDYPDLHLTSDTNYKLTSLSMSNIEAGDFTFSFRILTNVLESDDDRVSIPETEENKYIDVSKYLGAFRDIKDIVNNKNVALSYELDCTRYDEPVASTEGILSFDIDNFIVQLAGDVHIGTYTSAYDARYIGDDETIYLNFDDTFKLSYTNKGLGDLWTILDDKEVFPVSIFDLLWGASGKVYPVLDIIGDGNYLDLLDYFEAIDISDDFVSLRVDNTVWGGEGTFDLRVNFDENHITSIVFDNLDINDYKVNATLEIVEYKGIKDIKKDEYSSLDGLDQILKNTMPIYNSKQVGFGLSVNVKDKENKTLSLSGSAQLDLNNFNIQSLLTLNDFSNSNHNLILSTYSEEAKNYLCVGYTYQDTSTNTTLRAKTSYDSVMSVFQCVTGIMSRTSGEEDPELGVAVPVVVEESATTLSKVMGGDYVSILEDKAIKEFKIDKGNWYITLSKESLGLEDDLSLSIFTNEGKITSLKVVTKYAGYSIDAELSLREYNKDLVYVNESNVNTYYDLSSIGEVADYLVNTSSNGKFVVVDQILRLIEEKKVGLTLSGEILKGGEAFLALEDTSANIALQDNASNVLDLVEGVISGKLKYTAGGVTESAPFVIAAQGETFSFSFNNAISVKCDRDDVNDIVGLINKLSGSEESEGLQNNLNANVIPVLNYLNNKDYQSILKLYKGASIEDGELKITFSNGLFNSGDTSNFDLAIKIGEKGLESLKVTNLRYGSYTANLTLGVEDYETPAVVNTSSYVDIARIVAVVEQFQEIIENKHGHIVVDATYGDYHITGEAQVDLDNNEYHIDLTFATATDSYNIKLDNIDGYYYASYNDEYFAKAPVDNVNAVVAKVIAMAFDEDTALGEMTAKLIGQATSSSSSSSSNVDILGLLFEADALSISEINNVVTANIDGSKLGLTGPIVVNIAFNNDDTLKSVQGSLTYNSTPINATLTLKPYSDTYTVFDENDITNTVWTDATKAVTVVEYVTSLSGQTQKAVVNQVKDLMNTKKVSFSYVIDAYTMNNKTKNILVNTDGLVKLDLHDTEHLAAELAGTLYIRNSTETLDDDYHTTYRFNYMEKTLYLSIGNNMKLSIEQSSIQSLIAAISSLLPTNALDDVANVNSTTMPILEMINHGDYITLLDYISDARYDGGTLIIDIDNTLIGGSGTSVFTIVAGNNGLSSISIAGLNYSKYYLDLSLSFEDYEDIGSITTSEYKPLDDLGSVITSGVDYYNNKQYALGITAEITKGTGANEKTLTLNGEAQLNMKDGLSGGGEITLTDFDNRTHSLKMDTYQSDAVTPVDYLCLDYTYHKQVPEVTVVEGNWYLNGADTGVAATGTAPYTAHVGDNGNWWINETDTEVSSLINVKGKASYKSIIDIYNTIKDALSDNSSSSTSEEQNQLLNLITPLLGDITGTTLDKVLNGNYTAIIEDEMFESFAIDGNKYSMVIKGSALGLTKNIELDMWTKDVDNIAPATGTHKELDKLRLDASLLGYDADITLQLNTYNPTKRYIPLADMQNDAKFPDESKLSTLVDYIKTYAYDSGNGVSLDSFGFISQILGILEKQQVSFDFSKIAFKQKNKTNPAVYDTLYTLKSGSVDLDFGDDLFVKIEGEIIQGELSSDPAVAATQHGLVFSGGIQEEGSGENPPSYLHLKIGDSVKIKIQRDKLTSILSKITSLLGNGSSSSESSGLGGLSSISLPVMSYISTGNYQAIMNAMKGINVTEEGDDSVLNITFSNSLFNAGDETSFTLSTVINQGGFERITVSNLHFQDYEVDGTVALADFDETPVDTSSGYCDLSDIDVAVDQFLDMLYERTFNIHLTGTFAQYSANAEINARLYPTTEQYTADKAELEALLALTSPTAEESLRIAELQAKLADPVYKAELDELLLVASPTEEQTARIEELQEMLYNPVTRYSINVTLVDNNKTPLDDSDDKTYEIIIDNDGVNTYVKYETLEVSIPSGDLEEIVEVVKGWLADEDSILHLYFGDLLRNIPGLSSGESSEPTSALGGGVDLIDFIFNEYLEEFIYTTTNESATGTLTARVDHHAFDILSDDAVLNIVINKSTHKVTGLNATASLKDGDNSNALAINATISDYDHTVRYNDLLDGSGAYDSAKVSKFTSMANTNTIVKYLDTKLTTTQQDTIIKLLKNVMDDMQLSIDYEISLAKGKSSSDHIADATGRLDADLTNIDDIFNTTISLHGDLTKSGVNLDSTYDLRLVNGVAYFSYNHDANSNFKVQYTLSTLSELKAMLNAKAETNPTLRAFMNSMFPDNSDNASDLSKALAEGGDVFSLVKHYLGAYVDRGVLYLRFSGKMIDNNAADDAYIDIGIGTSLDENEKSVYSIYVSDFYAMGYYLSGKFTFNYKTVVENNKTVAKMDYVAPEVPEDANDISKPNKYYVPLDGINDVAEEVIDYFSSDEQQVAHHLHAEFGEMLIDADAIFHLNTTATINSVSTPANVGNLNVKFTSGNRTHYVDTYIVAVNYQADPLYEELQNLKAKKVKTAADEERITELEENIVPGIIEDAYDNSKIYLAYGDTKAGGNKPSKDDMLYATLTIGTISDVYDLFKELTSGENQRLANIMEMFSSDDEYPSIFSRIVNGEIEAFLYNKIFKTFAYAEGQDDNHINTYTYTITVDGNIFKASNSDMSENNDLTLTLQTKDKYDNNGDPVMNNHGTPEDLSDDTIKRCINSLSIEGNYGDTAIDASLAPTTYVEPAMFELPDRIEDEDDMFNFSTVDNLVDYLFHTVEENDFVIDGNISLVGTVLGYEFENATIPIEAYLKITTDEFGYENYRAKITFTRIPVIHALGMYYVSDNRNNVWNRIDRDQWIHENIGKTNEKTRTFTIYIDNLVDYNPTTHEPVMDGDNVQRTNHVVLLVEYYKYTDSSHRLKQKTLTLGQFTDDLTYYLLNFGFGIKARDASFPSSYPEDIMEDENGNPVGKDDDFLNFHNYHQEDNYMARYSKLLTEYTYTPATDGGVWTFGIDLEELLNNNLLDTANVGIAGKVNGENKYISQLIATTEISYGSVAVIDASISLEFHQGTEVGDDVYGEINSMIKKWGSTPKSLNFVED